MDNNHGFRQVKQPHDSIAGDWLCDAGGDLLLELVPDSLCLLAVAVFIIVGICWIVWFLSRLLMSQVMGHS
jgi:hypothetical protein